MVEGYGGDHAALGVRASRGDAGHHLWSALLGVCAGQRRVCPGLSDWLAETETIVTLPIGASPAVMEVVNAGTADARDLVLQLASGGTNGYTNPAIQNTTTGEWLSFALTGAAANHRLRVETGRAGVERSTDGGQPG